MIRHFTILIALALLPSIACTTGNGNVAQGWEWQRVSLDTTPPAPSELSQRAESTKTDILKAFAQGLRDDAYSIQMKGNYQEAIIRYRKSLAYLPDPELEKYIRQVEIKAAPAVTGSNTVQISDRAQKIGTVVATIRNRSKRSVYIFPQGKTFSPDTLFKAGEIRFVPVQMQPDGKIIMNAGYDGIIVDSVTWTGDPGNPAKIPSVFFDDQSAGKKLEVMTGLR